MPDRVFTWIIHYVVVELKNDHQTDECLTKKSSRTTNHRLKLTVCKVQPANFTVLLDPFSKHITVLCSPNFSTMKSLNTFNRDLPKVTLCMNSGWFDSSEASHKKAHWLVEGEMSSHLFFYKSIWSFFMTHLSCIGPARVHVKSRFGRHQSTSISAFKTTPCFANLAYCLSFLKQQAVHSLT